MRSQSWAITGVMVLSVWVMPPAAAQVPSLPILQSPTLVGNENESDNRVVSRWVYLDGRRLFQIAAPRATVSERLQDIQHNLVQISQDYFHTTSADLNVEIRTENNLPVIYVNNRRLLTVTPQDARLRQLDRQILAEELVEQLEQELQQAKQERQPEFLIRQSGIAGGTGLVMILTSWLVYRWQRRSTQQRLQPFYPTSPAAQQISTKLSRQHDRNMKEVKRRLLQLAQTAIWGGGTLTILGLFPYTRSLQLWIFTALQIPFKLGIVGLGTYVVIRLSYALIDRFTSALVISGAFLTPETSERLRLRVSTISGVTKSIATAALAVIGTLVALTFFGIDIGPLLAGAGLVGVAVSLASQNLIKDAINGFLIIVEDQYALGDVIAVGDVAGLVENLNLRITQLRDSEGRLITIPNSEIKMVANLSNRWSRADLNIPVAYNADIDQALKVIETVGLEMDRDPQWQDQIVETPQVLGVENFADRGLIIRVWIKTQPLKQWDVAREYRRRVKIAFDQAGIAIPLPQQTIWLNEAQPLKSHSDGGLG